MTSSRRLPRSSTRWRTGDPSLPSAWASAASCASFSDVRRAPFLGWRDVDLGAKLTSRLRCPVALANDLAALMEAEHWFGDGRSVEHFAVLTIGASVGGALVVHDRLVTGADAGLGLLGHFPIDPLGPACAEGHRGCAHSLMSIDGVQSQAALAFGRHVPYAEVLDLAEAGDPAADRIVGTAARALGTLIAAVANIAMPERVILTGEGIRLAQVGWERVLDGVRSAPQSRSDRARHPGAQRRPAAVGARGCGRGDPALRARRPAVVGQRRLSATPSPAARRFSTLRGNVTTAAARVQVRTSCWPTSRSDAPLESPVTACATARGVDPPTASTSAHGRGSGRRHIPRRAWHGDVDRTTREFQGRETGVADVPRVDVRRGSSFAQRCAGGVCWTLQSRSVRAIDGGAHGRIGTVEGRRRTSASSTPRVLQAKFVEDVRGTGSSTIFGRGLFEAHPGARGRVGLTGRVCTAT